MNKPASELIALADDHLRVDRAKLAEWADDFEAAAHEVPRGIKSTILMTRAQEVRAALTTPPAQPAPAATHGKPDGAVREALRNLLDYAEQRECSHEATHRGGSIWTICDECGKKWADDRGGFIPYQEPKEITQARAALHSPKIAAAETSPGDATEKVKWPSGCRDPDSCARHSRCMYINCRHKGAAIDRLDVKAEAKSQEPEAVAIKPLEWYEEPLRSSDNPAWNADSPVGTYRVFKAWWGKENKDGWIGNGEFHHTEIAAKAAAEAAYEQRIRSALIHPTTKPEAPAVSVDAIKDLVRSFHRNSCYPEAGTGELNAVVNAIAALIAGGR